MNEAYFDYLKRLFDIVVRTEEETTEEETTEEKLKKFIYLLDKEENNLKNSDYLFLIKEIRKRMVDKK